MTYDRRYLDMLPLVAEWDVQHLLVKEKTYRGSWKASGGRSAWFMMRRKIDRLLNMMARPTPEIDRPGMRNLQAYLAGQLAADSVVRESMEHLMRCYVSEDVFAKIEEEPSGDDGTVLAEIRDLRRYLLLIEAEMTARGVVSGVVPKLLSRCDWDLSARLGYVTTSSGHCSTCSGDLRGPSRPGKCRYETIKPGTPEDGGHHAQQDDDEPWILTQERGRLLPPEVWDTVYSAYHPKFRILLPWISEETERSLDLARSRLANTDTPRLIIDDIVKSYWMLTDHPRDGFVLNLSIAPSGEHREKWPRLRRELNNTEFGELLSYQKSMYEWREGKFVLKSEFEGWLRDEN